MTFSSQNLKSSKFLLFHKFGNFNEQNRHDNLKPVFIEFMNLLFLYGQFEKPGRRKDFDYPQMVKESVTKALVDANVKYTDIDQAVCGYVFGLYLIQAGVYFHL